MFLSRGTVASNQNKVLVAREKMTISGRDLVSTRDRAGIVGLPKKSKLTCQSDALLTSSMDLRSL